MYSIVFTTCKSLTDRDALVEAALGAKLAACVQVDDVVSHYVWEGKLEQDDEYRLTFKTRSALVPELMAKIREVHTYEVPQIVACEITSGLPEYFAWIDESTKGN
ncbi:MAG: divalent-cation tolerance protein CutA [Blastochloris viridis]|uniref:Divalent-cation tolerance protein CutA n=1 Tax=Blastochloris viridis TaxID=1079 RepID=A0A6N4REG2_BLAVI|nr:MAG: divalent-cation tolerance protein CutA [Blastochloris viridis]